MGIIHFFYFIQKNSVVTMTLSKIILIFADAIMILSNGMRYDFLTAYLNVKKLMFCLRKYNNGILVSRYHLFVIYIQKSRLLLRL